MINARNMIDAESVARGENDDEREKRFFFLIFDLTKEREDPLLQSHKEGNYQSVLHHFLYHHTTKRTKRGGKIEYTIVMTTPVVVSANSQTCTYKNVFEPHTGKGHRSEGSS